MSAKKRSEEEIDSYIENLIGSMALEDITLSDECLDGCRAILRGETTADEEVAKVIEKLRKEQEG